MKKFYAIMAAALAATCVASAQLPASLSIKDAKLVPTADVILSEAPAPSLQVKSATEGLKGLSTRANVSRADEFEAINGDYVFTYYDGETPFSANFNTTNIVYADGKATLNQFYFTDSDPLTAAVGYYDVEFSDGTVNMPLLVIPNMFDEENRTPIFRMPYVEGGADVDWYLILHDYVNNKWYGKNDLEFVLYPESGEISFLWNSNFGLGLACEEGYVAPLAQAPVLFKKNAEMSAMFYSREEGFFEMSCPVWTYAYEGKYVDQNQQPTGETFTGVLAAGWAGCGEVIRFICEEVEENAYVAAAYDQVGWTAEDGQEFYFCDAVIENNEPNFAWVVDGEEKTWMVANVGVDGDGNTVFTQDGLWLLIGDQDIVTYWQEGVTVFDYYIGVGANGGDEPDGVEAIDSNDNAPAEYYNLQGVKVANPTPGQLYIVKQGSKVSKVIR